MKKLKRPLSDHPVTPVTPADSAWKHYAGFNSTHNPYKELPKIGAKRVSKGLNVANSQVSSQEQLAMNFGFGPSEFNTKETFLHFGHEDKGCDCHQKSFFLAYYRRRNLILADKLDSIRDEPEFNGDTDKVVRNIRWCASRGIVSKNEAGTGEVVANSQTCKNPHCAICSRRRSAKLGSRFVRFLNDPVGQELTKGKYWYFVTFTLKHNADSTRSEVYLKELRKHMAKFVRQKAWTKHFGKIGKTWQGGWVSSYEMTLTDNGYHIHSHMLVCGNKVKQRFKDYEKELKANWLKLTGDSWNVRFDAVKPEKDEHGISRLEHGIEKRVIELYKYTTKLERLCNISKDNLKRYATWISETKGKNFVNASGIFRGHKLTAAKSPWDPPKKPVELDEENEYFFIKTNDLRFNYTLDHNYKPKERKRIFGDINLDYVDGGDVIDITDMVEDAMSYVRLKHDDYAGSIYGNIGPDSRFQDNRLWFDMARRNPIPLAPTARSAFTWKENESDESVEDELGLSEEEKKIWRQRFQSQLTLSLFDKMDKVFEYDSKAKESWSSSSY
ncbi:MAG: protein rep [Bacteroidota bacterium]